MGFGFGRMVGVRAYLPLGEQLAAQRAVLSLALGPRRLLRTAYALGDELPRLCARHNDELDLISRREDDRLALHVRGLEGDLERRRQVVSVGK